jgi:hypothetical protein
LTFLAWERIAPGGWLFFSRLICLPFGLCFVLKGGQIHLQFFSSPHPLSTGLGAHFLFGGNLDEGDSTQSGSLWGGPFVRLCYQGISRGGRQDLQFYIFWLFVMILGQFVEEINGFCVASSLNPPRAPVQCTIPTHDRFRCTTLLLNLFSWHEARQITHIPNIPTYLSVFACGYGQ